MAKVFERVLLVWGSFNTGEILRRTRFLFCTVAHDTAPRSDCGACSHWNVHRPEHRFRPWIATRTRECSWCTSECRSPRKKRGFPHTLFHFPGVNNSVAALGETFLLEKIRMHWAIRDRVFSLANDSAMRHRRKKTMRGQMNESEKRGRR